VHNLDRMTPVERRDFMSACSGKVCVAYTVRIPASGLRRRALPALTAAALAVSAMAALPAAAEEQLVVGMSPVGDDPNGLPNCDDYGEWIVVGGVNKGDEAKWADDGKDAPPELPTIEDDGR
jgi:hypothetical protein